MSSNEAGISSHVFTPNAIATGLQPSGADSARLAAADSPPESPSRPAQAGKVQAGKPETSSRVSVSLLDQLINLADELVLSCDQLLQTINSGAVLHRGVQTGKQPHRPAQHRPRSQP